MNLKRSFPTVFIVIDFLKKYYPDIMILLGVFILGQNYFQNESTGFGILLMVTAVDILIRKNIKKL